ncbi:hypothetical protein HMPREF3198_02048 [Winkia neuii]|nr:hypothetical protein HMPREF3198_02048 [Winkia neuii]
MLPFDAPTRRATPKLAATFQQFFNIRLKDPIAQQKGFSHANEGGHPITPVG